MGYQVFYKYYKMSEDGSGYDKENELESSIKVGSPYEDVPLEKVAGKVIALMARRNIFVKDVEIFEFAKKQLSFKESDDGIVIKNRKFKFEDGADITGEKVEESNDDLISKIASDPELKKSLLAALGVGSQPQANKVVPSSGQNINLAGKPTPVTPMKYETFNPIDKFFVEREMAKGKKLKFTVGKRYPIYEEKIPKGGSNLDGITYRVKDDSGAIVEVTDKLFTPQAVLSNSEDTRGLTDLGVPGGYEQGEVPSIR